MTDEQKAAANEKRRATYEAKRQREQADKEEYRARRDDRQRAIDICRQIRDNPDSTDREKLDAIKMLSDLTAQPQY